MLRHPGTRQCREVTTPGPEGQGERRVSVEFCETVGRARGRSRVAAVEKCSLC